MRSIGRRAARKDTNHAAIVNDLRTAGVIVEDMPIPGDVLCYFKRPVQVYKNADGLTIQVVSAKEVWMPFEIKSPNSVRHQKSQKTKQQEKSLMPIPIIETADEALKLMGIA